MKTYPTIPKTIIQNKKAFVFSKFDGSNIRCEWNNKKGFYKFGSRTQLLTPYQGIIYSSIDLIKQKEKELSYIAKQNKWDRCIFFFEFVGPRSLFGNHYEDDTFETYLIDVSIHKQGILNPSEFINTFSHLDFCAPLLYTGLIDDELITSVKQSTLKDMPLEGVVCKIDHKPNPLMFKIKSEAWIQKLRDYCAGNQWLYKSLL